MTDSTIGVAEPGTPTKLLQSYQNTVSSQTVQAEGVVQVDLNGVPVPRGTVADPVLAKITDGANSPSIVNGQPASSAYAIAVRPIPGATQTVNFAAGATVIANPGTLGVTTAAFQIGGKDGATGVTPITSFPDVTGQEGLLVFPEGSQSQILQQEATTFELQVVQHVGSTGIDPRQIRALAGTDKPDITANQIGILKVTNANIPLLSIDPQGSLQVNNNQDRAIQERIVMLAEISAINSLIAADNGPGARNYQELR